MTDYITDGAEIYRRSFAMIRAESAAGLARLAEQIDEIDEVAVRMIHAAGQVDLVDDIAASPQAVTAGRAALAAGRPIITDVTMVSNGVTRRRLPADNTVLCLLNDPATRELATTLGTTRSAAAVELWRDYLDGAVIAIGNAPTALFHLLDLLEAEPDLPRPAVIVGIPVGFIGAAESKLDLAQRAAALGVEYITVHGRRGGSAITCACLNALACKPEILA